MVFVVWSVLRRVTKPERLSAGSAAARGWWIDPSDASLEYDEWELDNLSKPGLPIWEIDHPHDLTGPILIVTHAWGESKLAALQRVPCLIPHFSRVVLWDLPAHGDAPERGRCRLGVHESEQLRALIKRSSDQAPTILYGWGMGARIALAEAIANPQVIGTIIERPSRNFWCEIRQVLQDLNIPKFPIGTVVGAITKWLYPRLEENDLTSTAAQLRRPLLVFPAAARGTAAESTAREVADAAATSEYIEFEEPEIVHLMAEGDRQIENTIRDFVQTCVARSNLEKRHQALQH